MTAHIPQDDVIIIGGGLAGLSAATYLARSGKSVTVFEKATELGGRASTRDEHGFLFSRGAHALYTGGAASEVLKELSISYDYSIPRATFIMQGNRFGSIASDPLKLLQNPLLNIADKIELIRLLGTLPLLDTYKAAKMSVQEWINKNTRRVQVRRLFEALARTNTYTAAIDEVSAQVFLVRLLSTIKSPPHYIHGGWQTLVESLRKAAEQAGAKVVSGSRVEAVICEGDTVKGVRLHNGDVLYAPTVIIATDPQEAAKLVDSTRYPALQRVVDSIVPVEIACLDVALSHLPSTRYPVVQDMDKPRFLTNQSFYIPIAPQGSALISTFRQLDPWHPLDPRDVEHELEEMLDVVQPGWREALVKRIYLPHIDAAGMLPTARSGGFAGRPTPQIAGIANLYLIGDWIGPEGYLIDASLASARQVVRDLLQHSTTAKREDRGLTYSNV